MNTYVNGQRIIAISIALGGRLGYEFHDYCGPHNPNHHASLPRLCELECVDAESNTFVMTRVWNADLDEAIVKIENGPKVKIVAGEGAAMHGKMHYFDVENHHLFLTSRFWLNADHYIQHLAGIIDDAVVQEDPYLYSKERFFRQIRELKSTFQHESKIPSNILDTPSLTIPSSRYQEFSAGYDESKGQRWGQAFYDYMQAHKVVQDMWWWDRLYNAPSHHARSMVRAVLDYDN